MLHSSRSLGNSCLSGTLMEDMECTALSCSRHDSSFGVTNHHVYTTTAFERQVLLPHLPVIQRLKDSAKATPQPPFHNLLPQAMFSLSLPFHLYRCRNSLRLLSQCEDGESSQITFFLPLPKDHRGEFVGWELEDRSEREEMGAKSRMEIKGRLTVCLGW